MSGEYHDRIRKRDQLKEMNINPYPARFESTHSVAEAIAEADQKAPKDLEQILKKGPQKQVTVRGRIMTLREHGKLAFLNLKDVTGTLQICFMQDAMDKEKYKLLRKFDMGDFIGVSGELFFTRHGQLTVLVNEVSFLGKALLPLPEKWHGLKDQESIYRQRHLDLIMNEDSMKRFRLRSQFIQKTREYLNQHQFMEVETPVLASKASGATARPFSTHHNALDLDVYLRIAPELYLKRCIAGGFERVYEFANCFRNEGMDPSHLQEFTMLEYYVAYWNYEDNMRFTEQMLTQVIQDLFGCLKLNIKSRDGKDVEVDFKAPWPRVKFGDLIQNDCGIDIYEHYEDADSLRKAIQAKKILIEDADKMGYGNLCDALYKKVSRPKLIQPTFVVEHPASTKPLARRSEADPRICESFQLLVNTWEIVNAYSEIVDPEDQQERFMVQAMAQAGGDEDAMEMDVDYIRCMENGMPPISGWGMGIDRIVTLLTGQDNLKDVVLFPLLKPLESDIKEEKKLREKAKKRNKKEKKK